MTTRKPLAPSAAQPARPHAREHAAPSVVPRIETQRLLLRELRADDLDSFAENLADPLATVHLGGVTDRRAAWRVLAAGVGFWVLNGAGWWAVALRDSGEMVGTVGAFFRETSPELELGWAIYRRHWGHGFATEAARAAAAFGFQRHGVACVIAHIDPGNGASIRVSQHLGMRYEGEVDFYDGKTGRYVLER